MSALDSSRSVLIERINALSIVHLSTQCLDGANEWEDGRSEVVHLPGAM